MIFRVRYCDENTIDELTNSYLWFFSPGKQRVDIV